VWLTHEESNELNGCQYLDRTSPNQEWRLREGRYWISANFLEGGATVKIIRKSPMTNEIGSRISRGKHPKMSVGSGKGRKARRDLNAAPRTTPTKKAVRKPACGVHVPGD